MSPAACGACEPCREGHQNVCDESSRYLTGEMIADGGFRVTNKDDVGVTQFCI